jgi:hypothetical protein
MALIVPSWFKQRQCTAEPAGENLYRLTGPNLAPAFLGIRQAEAGKWLAFLRLAETGPDAAATEARFDTPSDAWEAAFELYRLAVIV